MAGILDFLFDPDESEAPWPGPLPVRRVARGVFDPSAGTTIPEDVPFGSGGPSQAPFRPMPLWPDQLFFNSPGNRGQLPENSSSSFPDLVEDRRLGGPFGVGAAPSPSFNLWAGPRAFNLPPSFDVRPDNSRLKLPGSLFSAAPQNDAGANGSTSEEAVQSDVSRGADVGPKPFEPLIPYWAGAFANSGLGSQRNGLSRPLGKNWGGAAPGEMPAGANLITPMPRASAPQMSPSSDASGDNDPQQTRSDYAEKSETVLKFLGARQAADGNLYIPDPTRPGKYLVMQSRAQLPQGVHEVVTPPDVLSETRKSLNDALYETFVQPLADGYNFATGKMSENEARLFALQTVINAAGGASLGRAAVKLAEGFARSPILSAARGPKTFGAPDKLPRNAGGNLAEDIEGRPLHAHLVAGRRVPGGPDEPLTYEELRRLIWELTGDWPRPLEARLMRGRLGGTLFEKGEPPKIFYREGLSGEDRNRVLAHEVGHILQGGVEIPPRAMKDLSRVYSTLQSGKEGRSPLMTPRERGYPESEALDELFAEGIRAYLTNPNYMKTVAPDASAFFRAHLNAHPVISQVLQLNAIAAVAGAQLFPVDYDPFAPTAERPAAK